MEETTSDDLSLASLSLSPLPSTLTLDTLPAEIILHILQFIEVRYICRVLARVCSYFSNIARSPTTWRVRLAKRWPGQYPALPPPPSMDWGLACARREEETWLWTSHLTSMGSVVCSNAHYSSVDTIQVLDDVVLSGSRDRGVNVWSLDAVRKGEDRPGLKCPDSHKGWVWSFSPAGGNSLVSGSWDNTVKFWQVTPTSLVESRKAVNLKVAVLATDALENRVVAGTYDKKVIMMDKREDQKKMTFYKCHSKPVLAVKITDRLVLSLSEDKNLVVYDRAAGRRMKKVEIPGPHFPMCLSLHGSSLYVGDKGGGLHLLDCTNDRFDVVQQYSTGHSGKITSVVHGLGSVITSSTDGDIKVFHPSRKLELVTTIKSPDCGEAAELSYSVKNKVLAAAFSNNTVKIWTKNNLN